MQVDIMIEGNAVGLSGAAVRSALSIAVRAGVLDLKVERHGPRVCRYSLGDLGRRLASTPISSWDGLVFPRDDDVGGGLRLGTGLPDEDLPAGEIALRVAVGPMTIKQA